MYTYLPLNTDYRLNQKLHVYVIHQYNILATEKTLGKWAIQQKRAESIHTKSNFTLEE